MEKESQGIEIRSISIITHQKIKCLHYKTFFVDKIRRMCKSPQCSIGNGPQYSPVSVSYTHLDVYKRQS